MTVCGVQHSPDERVRHTAVHGPSKRDGNRGTQEPCNPSPARYPPPVRKEKTTPLLKRSVEEKSGMSFSSALVVPTVMYSGSDTYGARAPPVTTPLRSPSRAASTAQQRASTARCARQRDA
jgi:hypothetical protein